jgi:hypothetical protein
MAGLGRAAKVSTVLLLVAACEKELPVGPSDLADGVILYEHANFQGTSAHVTEDVSDLSDFKGPCEHASTSAEGSTTTYDWNDCISSVRVAAGWQVEVFRDGNYRGQSHRSTGDVPNLQLVQGTCDHDGLNDCVTSVRVRPSGLTSNGVADRAARATRHPRLGSYSSVVLSRSIR